jgi:poly-gamma-glutamate synthesis protein (capsule biosynthesis protein)
MTSTDVFLSGDVMTGRGIDQIMRHPSDPVIHERWAQSAVDYVELAEQRNGPIPRGVDPEYVWGDALETLDEQGVDVGIINLETAVTDDGEPWPGKGIHYRMHPSNLDVIGAARVDCCVLANNHVLDWSYPGLTQTLATLREAGLSTAGAGSDLVSATRASVIENPGGARVLVVAVGMGSSGIPFSWAAAEDRPGVAYVDSPSDRAADSVVERVATVAKPGDLVVSSIHWGPNWGYEVPRSHRRFAHRLVDSGRVHIVHGHSSHHPLGIEVYRGRPILYGCGDLINDYEGIEGYEEFHPDLGILYLASMDSVAGTLSGLQLVPMRMRRFSLERAPSDDVMWLEETLDRESRPWGTHVEVTGDSRLRVIW